ncbi:MAG: matrixin family metalloprotease [Verrucomicrobiales bacterium]|nr:matrixin family metalloprotease [Verrucomicrobiales bacterium]
MKTHFALILLLGLTAAPLQAITIVVDYSLDSNNFFNNQDKRDAMQAVADRYSRVITSSLAAVSPSGTGTGTSAGWRIGFKHPGTGASYQITTAANQGSDPLDTPGDPDDDADEYGFAGLATDVWILYAGARPLSSKGQGGTGTGLNFTSTFNDINGPMHRGFNDNTPSSTASDLPRWGGAITFDSNATWHFDLSSVAPFGASDFYSIALHEVGHALGLSTSWNQWNDNGGGVYVGSAAIAAYNLDNPGTVASLNLVSPSNPHFADGTYDSFIFASGTPITIGTVGSGLRQDLLMDPIANFSAQQKRFELTNVDVAALRDVGWETLAGVAPDPVQQPDNKVGPNLLTTIGDGIYNSAAGQTFTLISKRGAPIGGIVSVENDGDLSDNFLLSGSRGTSLFRVTYKESGGNITAAMISGTHQTGALAAGASANPVSVQIRPARSKLKKVIRRGGRRIVRFKKKRFTAIVGSESVTKATARDISVLKVRTK